MNLLGWLFSLGALVLLFWLAWGSEIRRQLRRIDELFRMSDPFYMNLHELASELAKMEPPSGYDQTVVSVEAALEVLGQRLWRASTLESMAILSAIVERAGAEQSKEPFRPGETICP